MSVRCMHGASLIRVVLLVQVFLSASVNGLGQKGHCEDRPTLFLASSDGYTCGTSPLTVSDITFGGSATEVFMSEDGDGYLDIESARISPFSFTYTPADSDIGKKITITLTTNNPLGIPCKAAIATYSLAVNGNPNTPGVESIIDPTCSLSTGSVTLNNLPPSGQWTLTQYPENISAFGTGSSTLIPALLPGVYTYTITDSIGCTSVPSENIVIHQQPLPPTAPVIEEVTQPTYVDPSGSVLLGGLPSTGTWTVTRTPGEVNTTGTGTATTVYNLPVGVYRFRVTSSGGCVSSESDKVEILEAELPVLLISNPTPACFPATVDITNAEITKGSTPGLIFTFWTDAAASIPYYTPTTATAGTYYIKGTMQSGYYIIKPVIVTVNKNPIASAGPDQILDFQFETTMNAENVDNAQGIWSLISGEGKIHDLNDPKTLVTGLDIGINIFRWTVYDGVCPESSDTTLITVNDQIIPTLITPNNDGKNDFFIMKESEWSGITGLFIFDRRGVLVFKNDAYDNKWNGVDLNNNPLPDDTYFYLVRTSHGRQYSGFIVIRH